MDRPMIKSIWQLLLAVLAVSSMLLVQLPAVTQDRSQQATGLELAIQKSLQQTSAGIQSSPVRGSLRVATARIVQMDDLGFEAYAVKVLDPTNDEIYSYWYDEDVQAIAENVAFRARAAAYEARYGRLSQSLYQRIHQSEFMAETPIPVAIWAEQSVGADVASPPGPYRVFLPLIAGGVGSPIDRILQFLSERGYAADYVSSEAPVVYANIPSSVINELQAQSYVAAIYDQVETEFMMDSAARTSAAPWTWERGITGAGIKVAVLEQDGVAFDNPYIDGSDYYIGWWKRVDSHATQVAGVIASDHSDFRGIAYDAEILSANALLGIDSAIIAAADWAVGAGADVINASIGKRCGGTSITSLDKYFDWIVWEERRTVTVSAGNVHPNCSSNHNVTAPGKAYNVITVGAKDDQNTATT
jgi:hypothetical protein